MHPSAAAAGSMAVFIRGVWVIIFADTNITAGKNVDMSKKISEEAV